MVNRDRIGVVSWGSGPTSVKLKLAQGRDVPVQKSWQLPALPPTYDPSEFTVNEPTNEAVRRWKVSKFSGGEGAPIWDGSSDEYNKSIGVRPALDGRGGLELCAGTTNPTVEITSLDLINDAQQLAYTGLGMVVVQGVEWHEWAAANGLWATGAAHSLGTVNTPPAGFGSYLWAIDNNGDLYRLAPGGTVTLWVDRSADLVGTNDNFAQPVIFQGQLYCVWGANLYEIDMTTPSTVTLLSDVRAGLSHNANTRSACAGDVGPVWYFLEGGITDGQVRIYQYNVGAATTEPLSLSDVPPGAYPVDIGYHAGFVFLTYKRADYYLANGECYLYYQRGQQRGSIGPIPRPDGATTALAHLGGLLGDLLVLAHGRYLWGYNLSQGAISMLAALEGSTDAKGVSVLSGNVFVLIGEDGDATDVTAEHVNVQEYTVEADTHYLDVGRFDFGWPGMDKALIDIIVSSDPLPANTTIQVAYSVDGGSFTTHATTSSTDGDTVHRFTVSTPTTPVIGESFELRLILATTDTDVSPRVWEIMARASIDELEFTYDLEIDIGDALSNPTGEAQILADLETLAAVPGYVNFENPWQVAATAEPTTEVVKVVAISKPEIGEDGIRYCTLRLKGRDVA